MRRALFAPLLFVCLSCGSGGGSSAYKDLANKCATPRVGADPVTGKNSTDKQGSLNDEKSWLKGWETDFYLWYRELPTLDPAKYTTALDYFNALKTPATTPSGKPKDQFHFTYLTPDWERLSQSGVEAGYGVTWVLVARSPPRKAVVGYTEPNSPATAAGLVRGDEVIQVDSALVVDGDKNVLNAGLFPAALNETHTFVIKKRVGGATQTISLKSDNITSNPVQNVGIIPGTSPKAGYILFNAHIGTAEQKLIDAVNLLKSQGAQDLILDLRYNGGGYLILASELAYMIANPTRTSGKTFEKTIFNDKYPSQDPITGNSLTPTAFQASSVGLSGTAGQALPHLDLDRVFVLTGGGTCSASESVINGLLGVDVQVNLIGHNTCGKPYGFYPQDNCGTTYFSIQFEGQNQKGFGEYSDGFVPGGGGAAGPPGCQVADDFNNDLGSPSEARVAAALQFRSTGNCPTPSSRQQSAVAEEEPFLVRNPFLENRILWRPQ